VNYLVMTSPAAPKLRQLTTIYRYERGIRRMDISSKLRTGITVRSNSIAPTPEPVESNKIRFGDNKNLKDIFFSYSTPLLKLALVSMHVWLDMRSVSRFNGRLAASSIEFSLVLPAAISPSETYVRTFASFVTSRNSFIVNDA
jgi:hypothetical protein